MNPEQSGGAAVIPTGLRQRLIDQGALVVIDQGIELRTGIDFSDSLGQAGEPARRPESVGLGGPGTEGGSASEE